MHAAEIVLWTAGAHLSVGVLFGLAFVFFGVSRLDEAARGSSLAFRLLILPGCVVLWPLVAYRWLRGPARSAAPSSEAAP
ncbi:MAG: hypothetical protein AB8I08_23375 [Sandaracinaceae bacterium]